MEEASAPGRDWEDEYRASRAALRDDAAAGSQGLVLVISMVVFAVSMSRGSPVRQILVTLAVLLLHELGHYVGMRAFGYRDVRMFFIPFFGAAVSGKPRGVKAWKDGIVSLLGPLPGIVLGLALALSWREPSAAQRDALLMLLVINVLNLLPLGGFDGSRFLQRILFSRHRYLEIAFLVTAGIALLVIAIAKQMWVIAIFAYLGLAVVPLRHRVLRAAATLKGELSGVKDARKLDDARGYELFLAAREAVHPANRQKPKVVSAVMDQIVEATRPPPGGLATIGLLSMWLAGFVLAFVAFAAMAKRSSAAQSTPFVKVPVPGGGFVVSMPEKMRTEHATPLDPRVVSIDELRAESGPFAYQVHVEIAKESFPSEEHASVVEGNLAKLSDKIVGPIQPVSCGGLPGRAVNVKETDGSTCRFTYLFDGARDITLAVCAAADVPHPPLDRLERSFEPSR